MPAVGIFDLFRLEGALYSGNVTPARFAAILTVSLPWLEGELEAGHEDMLVRWCGMAGVPVPAWLEVRP